MTLKYKFIKGVTAFLCITYYLNPQKIILTFILYINVRIIAMLVVFILTYNIGFNIL